MNSFTHTTCRNILKGGAFAEIYTSIEHNATARPYSGSIYFLLRDSDLSHFHEIDCEELWYFHEGCGVKITVLSKDGTRSELLLGPDCEKGQSMMVAVRPGDIFAAENLDPKGYTFMSCMTTPKFTYEGFRLVYKAELQKNFPDHYADIAYLAYDD